ncbi:MAG TPA: BREX system ATP-binding protein BrxD [Sorangium sp.]|nr:BREX system ATP-binding protein BrxD [Sorangium sp.]
MSISKRDREHIFHRLRSGVVPTRGLDAFAVGIDRHRAEIGRLLDLLEAGEGEFKFLRGGYGCGKTFMARLAVADAQARGFATSFVVVSDNDWHFHRFDDVYHKVVQGLGTSSCPRGALGDIIDRWIAKVEAGLSDGGADENAADFDELVGERMTADIAALSGGKAPEDLARVLRHVFLLKQQGNVRGACALVSWLSGSSNVSAGDKKVAGIKGDITSKEAMGYLRGIVEVVKAAGYNGLVIVIDEAETILRMRKGIREKSLNGIRQIIDAAASFGGLLWLFTGTPEFFDTRRGVAGLQPLHDRLEFLNDGGLVTMRQPQLELHPFNRMRLKDVALRLRDLYLTDDPNALRAKVTAERIGAMVDDMTSGFNGDVGVIPRQFLRRLVNLMDEVADYPGAALAEPRRTIQEKHAAEGKKPIDYVPEPGDGEGYAVTSVEF